jgi:hypothetical protein
VFGIVSVGLSQTPYQHTSRQTDRQTDRDDERYLPWNALFACLEFRAFKDQNSFHEPFFPHALSHARPL